MVIFIGYQFATSITPNWNNHFKFKYVSGYMEIWNTTIYCIIYFFNFIFNYIFLTIANNISILSFKF
jgi:hypothetical protein